MQRKRYRYIVLRRWNCYGEESEFLMIDLDKVRLGKMRKRIYAWAKVMEDFFSGKRMVMITLTYEKVDGYQSGHIREFLKRLKRITGEKLHGWAWVAELQKRGALHYHIIMVVDRGTNLPLPDKSGWWPHGMSKIETARSPWYLLTYTGKEFQKNFDLFPKNTRLYACSVRGNEKAKEKFKEISGLLIDRKKREKEKTNLLVKGRMFFEGGAITKDYAEKVLMHAIGRENVL